MTSTVLSGRERFKQHLRKVGSGEHTSKGMSREERHAMALMLDQEATPAQIGAFLIAHRIRRPEPQELTGMLDTYRSRVRWQSSPDQRPPLCFGMPRRAYTHRTDLSTHDAGVVGRWPTSGAAGRRAHAD